MDWSVNEVTKLEKKLAFYFETINKNIIMTEEVNEDFDKNVFFWFFLEKKF